MQYAMQMIEYGGVMFDRPTFLASFDPDADDGSLNIEVTHDVTQMRLFDSMAEVFEVWKTTSTTVPVRIDGKPNRPLTAFTISPVPHHAALRLVAEFAAL